jgi:hypothetical protein
MKKLIPLLLALLALPALADTPAPKSVDAKMSDASGQGITSTLNGAKRGLDCNVSNSASAPAFMAPVVGGSAVDPRDVRQLTTADQLMCGQLGSWTVIVSSSALPAGASTSALQTTGNASLSSIDAKTPALGQALKSGSTPVVIASDQGNLSFSLPSGASTSALQTAGNASLSSLDSKTPALGQATTSASVPVAIASNQTAIPVIQSGTWNVGSVTGSLPLPTGAATSALQTTGNSTLSTISSRLPASFGQTTMSSSLPVTIASNQSPLAVSQSGSWTVTVPLPTGAATSALQTTGNSSLGSIDGKLPTLGQKATSGSVSVTLSSDHGPVPVTGSLSLANSSVSATGSAVPADATMVGGSDGTNLRALSVTAAGVLKTDGSATTQPVSAASLPLPTGASTSALQTAGNASLSSVDGKLTNTTGGALKVDGSAFTQPVSAASLPLPSGAATAANQSTTNTHLSNLNNKVTSFDADSGAGTQQVTGVVLRSSASGGSVEAGTAAAPLRVDPTGTTTQPVSAASLPLPSGAATESTLSAVNGKLTTTANGLKVDNSGVTQPVSAASLPLPSGASTAALQTTGNSSLSSIDGKTPALVSGRVPVDGSGVTQPVSAASLPLPTGASNQVEQVTTNTKLSSIDGKLQWSGDGILVDGSAVTQPVSAASLPLPAGAATSALQTTGNSTLSTISSTATTLNGKFGTLGQKAMAGSAPVVIASDQSTLPVSAASLPLPSGAATEAKQDAGNASLSSLDSDVDVALSTRASEATLSSIDTKVSTAAKQDTGNASLSSIDGKLPSQGQALSSASLPVVIASDQSAVPVSQSGTWHIGNITGTVSLPTGASTSALQTTGNASLSSIDTKVATAAKQDTGNSSLASLDSDVDVALSTRASEATLASADSTLSSIDGTLDVALSTRASEATAASIDGKLNSLGQKAMAGSVPVTLASDQSPLAVSQSGTWNINNVSGTVSLPTGASTAANQATANASLSSIDTKLTSQATAARQDTGNASLASIDAGTPAALGQAAMSASMPVVISSDQSAVPASQSGTWSVRGLDGAGNALTSQASGSQRALDVGINVGGAQVDPRTRTWNLGSGSDSVAAVQSGTWNITNVTGTVSLPTGASTAANQATGNASLAQIDADLDVALSTRASESTLSTVNGKLNSLGQKVMTGSMPVTIASDQSAVPASQSGTWTVQQGSTPTTNANGWAVKPGDGTDAQDYTAAGEAKVLVTPLTDASVVKAELQDNAGNGLTSKSYSSQRALDVTLLSNQATTDVSGTFTTSGTSASIDALGATSFGFTVDVTAASGSTPTLDVEFQGSDDGTNWTSVVSARRFTATGVDVEPSFGSSFRYYRYSYTVGGGTPSFTFSVTTTRKAAPVAYRRSKNVYGSSLVATTTTPAFDMSGCLAASLVVLRANTGGGNATLTVQVSNDGQTWVSTGTTVVVTTTVPGAATGMILGAQYLRTIVTGGQASTADLYWHCAQ